MEQNTVKAGVLDVKPKDQQPGIHSSPIEHSEFISWQIAQLFRLIQSKENQSLKELERKVENLSLKIDNLKKGSGCSCDEIKSIIEKEIGKIPSSSGERKPIPRFITPFIPFGMKERRENYPHQYKNIPLPRPGNKSIEEK